MSTIADKPKRRKRQSFSDAELKLIYVALGSMVGTTQAKAIIDDLGVSEMGKLTRPMEELQVKVYDAIQDGEDEGPLAR